MTEPYLSVIVACYNEQDYVEQCLDSIANTNFPLENMEVLMVDDDSTDETSAIIDKYAEKYKCFRALHKTNGGISSTRNYGMKHARGKYIAFVDGDDIVPSDAYSNLIYKARKNQSDVVAGFVKRFDKDRYENSFLHSFAIHDDYDDTNLDDNHDLLYDTTVWNKIYRRQFLVENNIKFIEGMIYEDIPFTLEVHLKSKKTSIIENVVYEWRWRESTDSITQTRNALDNFESRLKALKISLDMLHKFGYSDQSSLVKDFKFKAIRLDINLFIENLGDNEEEYIYSVQRLVYKFLRDWNLWDSELFNKLSLKQQTMYYGIKKSNYDLINQFTYRKTIGIFKSSWRGHKYSFITPELEDDFGLKKFLTLDQNNSPIDQIIRNVNVTSITDGQFEMRGAFKMHEMPLFKRWFKDGNVNEVLKASIINVKNDKVIPANIERRGTHLLRKIMKPKAMYKDASYNLSFDINKAIRKLGAGTWKIKIIDKMDNQYWVEDFAALPGKKASNKKFIPYENNGYKVITKFNGIDQLVFNVIKLDSQVVETPVVESPRVVKDSVYFEVKNADISNLNAVLVDADDNAIYSEENADNGFKFEISKIHELFLNKKASLILRDNLTNAHIKYNFSSEKLNQQVNLPNNCSLSMYYGDTRMVMLYERTPLTAKSITVTGDNVLHFEADMHNFVNDADVLMKNSRVEMISEDKKNRLVLDSDANNLSLDNDVLSFKLPLTDENKEQLNVLKGNYEFKVYLYVVDHINVYRIKYTKNCLTSEVKLPVTNKQKIYYKFNKDKSHNIVLNIKQPFSSWIDSTKGLRSFSYSVLYPIMRFLPLRNIMIFDSYWSSKYDSNERLMYEYLVENHPEVKPVWFFNNIQTPIEGDAKKVKVNSFMYWYYLAVSRYIVQNTNMPNRYAKRSGQIEVETLHGTFLKHMGYDEPHFRLATKKIQNRFAKRNRRWDYMVVPSDYMEKTASQAFNYEQQIIKSGFPRNDELYTNDNSAYINSVKEKLGIPLNKRVILYAPTYREEEGFDFKLNLDKMQDKLSDSYVLLVRLHYFVAHSNSFYSNPGFVFDVSDYNNINDLYLISDAMVTDYSSVMFDYAHLKRPMIFYAYDKDWYLDEDNRGVYLDYDKQMPGPIVKNEDDLIDRIRHLDAVYDNYSDKLNQFADEFAQYGRKGDATAQVVETVLNTDVDELDQEPDNKLLFKKIGHILNTNFLQAMILNWLSEVLPKKDNLIMFESFFGRQYSDNPKAIYEYIKKHYPGYKLCWNVNKDYKEYFDENNIPYVIRFSYLGIWKQARAKYWITNCRRPFRWKPGRNVRMLQTWHGTPLKTLAADVMKVTMPGVNATMYHKDVFRDNKRWDRLITPNMYSAKIMHRAFRMNANQLQFDGYPRNDILINHTEDDVKRIKNNLGIDSNKKVVLYAPTWRDNEYIKTSEYTAQLHLDLEKIKQHYDNVIVLVRTHYMISNQLDLSAYSDMAMDVSQYEDIAELYLISDVLITDYSSVMFDYATLQRPIIFFTYDLDAYANEIRGFYFDFVKEAPGPLVKTTDDVIKELDKAFEDDWKPNDNYRKFIDKYAGWMDGKSSARTVKKLFSSHSLEMSYSDDLEKLGLSEEMTIADGAALWNEDKDFADSSDRNFAFNFDGDNQVVKVEKVMQLADPEFEERIGMQFALIQLNNDHYWVRINDLR